jgi:uncharacterized protein
MDFSGSSAHRRIVYFICFTTIFAAIIVMMQMLMPGNAHILSITWSPFVADAGKTLSVGVAGIIALLVADGSCRALNIGICRWWFFAIAAALPFAYCLAIYVPVWLTGLAGFAGFQKFSVRLAMLPLMLPIRLVFAAGEELGWRGVLTPNLAQRFGWGIAGLLTGAAWAVWHWPDIILFGFHTNAGIAFGLGCFSISCVALSVFLAWLTMAAKSIWPAVVFHGLHNTLVYGVFERVTQQRSTSVFWTTEFGVGLSVSALVVAWVFWPGGTGSRLSDKGGLEAASHDST